MTYRKKDWEDAVAGLATAQDLVDQFSQDKQKKHLLSYAILGIWSFGEYAINVVLELEGEPPEQNHRQADWAATLHARGVLTEDYFDRLSQLEKYRLKASHRGYTKNRTVHFSRQDVKNCLDSMLRLKDEVEALLRARGKL